MLSRMTSLIKHPRLPRLGEAVFIWTENRLEAGRVLRIEKPTVRTMERFHVYLIDQAALMICGRDNFALVPELRHLIPRMRKRPLAW